ncbi:hypothetical protein [Amycolatopsis thermoflava]|uniref:hypothetical protein n=1 Tax=Amycolatopsis thermoflava TaxID=84480 RepID=UPI0004147204|nr:hypothetical protein [Amycolatopsis thermoflava]
MTSTIVPGKHDPNGAANADGYATVPFIEVWRSVRGDQPVQADTTHRQHAPEETTVVDLLPISGALPADLPVPGPRFGAWAWLERLTARVRSWFAQEADEADLPAVVSQVEQTMPIPRHADMVALIEAAGARGLLLEVDPHFVGWPCDWCGMENAVAVMRVSATDRLWQIEPCRDCAPAAVRRVPGDADIAIEVPEHAADLVEALR